MTELKFSTAKVTWSPSFLGVKRK